MQSLTPVSPEIISLWFDEAQEARVTGRLDTAQALLDRIIVHDCAHAGALYARGLVALALDQLPLAQRWIERAIEVEPQPPFFDMLCLIKIKLRMFASIVQTARAGLAHQPESLSLHYYLGVALQLQGRADEAASVYRRLIELKPDYAQAHANLGVVVKELGWLREAEQHIRQAIALDPANRGARASLGQVLLAAGRYEEAWPYFEDRWANFVDANGQPAQDAPQIPLPQWKGERPDLVGGAHGLTAGGARLLVLPEQGHGDSLQFVRYLPLALERFARVGYICPPPLRRLYEESLCARWPGLVMLDDVMPNIGKWDWQCPLMSLPLAFGTRLDNIPAAPYLHADPQRSASWRARLEALPQPDLPRVGVVWAGGHSGLIEDRARSLTSAQLAPLFALSAVRWISLQKADDLAKRPSAATKPHLTDWMDDVADFADTAAIIDNLDLVISVDTSVAHLAAAMGKPVWLLNRFAGCWRWLRDRDDSPWYPGVRIFTQVQRGDWAEVIERVAAELRQRYELKGMYGSFVR
ncbi:tetratricopeptide repeat protein [Burkholderia sp. WSM2230]|uniref:tetratricopeptide repeat-containing glycosyltransferase family protein n=1 Tax=Burkholderia sp. WSM2230 TaxID=944435 RepID=UPI0004700B50|nr:tetratricopeptide repeat-containing glycosyltransferase family protein [Burkholderia sp. WSM2230]